MKRELSEVVDVFEKTLPLLFIPKDLRPYKDQLAEDIVRYYIAEPEKFWRGVSLRHAEKVNLAVRNLIAGQQCGSEELVASILNMARLSIGNFDRPIFVMGAGGSGSTWLGAMIGDVPGYRYGREIYVPPAIKTLFHKRNDQEVKLAIISIMVLHAWGLHHAGSEYHHNFVNSGRSIYDYPMLKKIWPRGTFLCLVRDPRDQLMSVTHRKAKFRAAKKPAYGDRQYLKSNAMSLKKIYKRIDKVNDGDICFVKYEQLKENVAGELSDIATGRGEQWNPSILSDIVFAHSAENMRKGVVRKVGNLDEGGRSVTWQEMMSEEDRKFVRPYIQDILEKHGYEDDSIWI